ncbi:AAA family ATPase, partial [Calothrix sp. CCY 0018]|uniref:ATP-binding sensor histidine kinase n=1 Tax=Calothrix sp. CCY 0018 TaxID=3103864 RepID=UPI0039C6A4DF
IVMKLMAKNAEDRYQSALGLRYDLEECLLKIKSTEKIADFSIAQKDICDRFIIPEKLYGRENEVRQLLEAFDRVANPLESEKKGVELMLIEGFSGIGKTAVVNEVHKPIVKQRGYFIKGKFDQFNRNIPFSAFVQAFRNLMGQLLTENNKTIEQWKQKILKLLGDNAQVIIEVIPELERIIGQQPPAPELSGNAAQNRFNLLFQKFLKLFTKKEHPLVIFLDDLQWVDLASLKLIQLLMSEGDWNYVLLIGAYRDNEVFPTHPLISTLDEIKNAGAIVNTITLKPLSQLKLNQLVADTLKCSEDSGFALSQLVHLKTEGNPFFATQFLKSLHEDNLIQFNFLEGCWQCEITQINQQALSSDVVEFMMFQLRRLPESTQDVLKLAACIGNQFDLETLATVSEQSQIETAACLWNALQAGLILPESNVYKFFVGAENQTEDRDNSETVTYKFLHDRIQQAAYSLIPEDQKQKTHYHIGQLLLQKIPPEAREERIFELINQLNYGINFIVEQNHTDELAQLNLIACRKARAATAYQAAREYAAIGLQLLGENPWLRQYEMCLAFHDLCTELAMLSGDFEVMEELIEKVIEHSRSLLEQVNVYQIRIQSSFAQNKLTEAIAIAQQILQQFRITFPQNPTPQDIQHSIAELNELIGEREIEDLVDLPIMTDEEKLAIIQIATSIMPAAYLSGSPLFPLLILLSVKLSIKYGNTFISGYVYASYAVLLCNFLQDVDTATQFGQLALQVVSKLGSKVSKPQALLILGVYILQRKSHIREILPLLQEGYATGLELGSIDFAGHNAHNFCHTSFWCGQPLAKLERETRNYCNGLEQFNQLTTASYCRIYWQPILNLLGSTEHPTILSGEALNETELLPQLRSANDSYGLYIFYLYKLMLCYLFEEIELAQNHAVEIKHYLRAGAGLVSEPAFYFYESLLALASVNSESVQTSEILQRVEQNQTQLQDNWANYAPMNHQHKFDLVEAEKCRVLKQKSQALELYEKAISGAKTNGYSQEEALANELAAKFYLDWDKEKIASGYMQEAYYCYARWGAKAKTDDLEKRYPQLLKPILQQRQVNLNPFETIAATGWKVSSSSTRSSTTASTSISDALDFSSILKAAQAISSCIELDELVTNLTKIILENSGAKKSVLILSQDNIWQVRAITSISYDNTLQDQLQNILISESIDISQHIPTKIINYVKNTQQTIVIDNCRIDIPGVIGEYMMEHHPKSVLCTPIINQGHLVGILYLENQIASGVFTFERQQIINLLASQAAISIENAHLYNQQQNKIQEISQKEAEYRSIFDNVNNGLSICDLETGKLVAANPAITNIYGYSQEEWLQLIPPDFVHPDYIYLFNDYLITLRQGKEFYAQGIGKRKDGSFFDFEVKAVSFIYKGKQHGLTIVQDISEQQTAQRERETAKVKVIQKSKELENALQNLQHAQLKIVQSEKMSALGNLVAGVAHEMNNPLGFINATLKQTKPTLADITEHLQLYQESLPEPGDEILDHAEEIDLDYSLEDLPKMIDAMAMACDRLKNISTSLRTFSRADKDYKVSFNIHDGLDSTILILKHRLKADENRPAIEVINEYGNIPKIECFPGQLNQVFMNILANAIDALEEFNTNTGRSFEEIKANPNKITVKTSVENNNVKILIADNGKGMSEEVKTKIFDHLFTTKGVGQGTGLGLAIARQIIEEKHGGKVSCNSVLTEGTEFILEIPAF